MSGDAKHAVAHSAAGFFAGLTATGCLHPLDLVKIRLQVQNSRPNTPQRYNGTFHAFRTILATEGPKALYQGVTPNLLGNSLAWGSYFLFYNQIKRVMQRQQDAPLSIAQHLGAGTLGGVMTLFVTNPVWVVKTRMVLDDSGARRYLSVGGALRSILKTEGLSGLYKGILPGLFGTTHGGIQFMVYEEMKRTLNRRRGLGDDAKLDTITYLAFASISKTIAGTATYPYQVVRSCLQQAPSTPSESETATQTVKSLWRSGGIRSLYRGLGPYLIRVMPATCITFVVYEHLHRFFLAQIETGQQPTAQPDSSDTTAS